MPDTRSFPPPPIRGGRSRHRVDRSLPAVLVVAFGTSTRASVTFASVADVLARELPHHEIQWAYASNAIRLKLNASRPPQDRLSSVPEALAELRARGFTRVAVQPLYVVPGDMYGRLLDTAAGFPGLHLEVAGTLLHRWRNVHRLLDAVARDFLPSDEGFNVLVAHGTPSAASAANIVYLGLQQALARRHPNARLGMVEGLVRPEETLEAARAHPGRRVRFIPFMVVAGDHIMNDVLGEDGGRSWRSEMEAAGKHVDVPTIRYGGQQLYRGLGFLPETAFVLLDEIRRAMGRL